MLFFFKKKQTVVGSNSNHPSNTNPDLFDLFVLKVKIR